MKFDPVGTPKGRLPPWEIAKAVAYSEVLKRLTEDLSISSHEILGERVDTFISQRLFLVGGAHPTERAVRRAIENGRKASWHPGKTSGKSTGRPPQISEHQKNEIARVAMSLKKRRICPSPSNVRIVLPKLTVNPVTENTISGEKFRDIYRESCYDETEDDPWTFRTCLSQDYLPEALKPLRVKCAKHALEAFSSGAWWNHIAFDPCSSLLPRTQSRLEDQEVAAMGKRKWMSKSSARSGSNLRAPATALRQPGNDTLQVHWTPVLARGKIRIYVCDAESAATDESLPGKLNDTANLSKFIKHVLPDIVEEMKSTHQWHNVPKTLVHDKASYMVTNHHDMLNTGFARAVADAGFRSWIGGAGDSTKWLVARWGDVYPHETAISHIRRLLRTRFRATRICETLWQFKARMYKVQEFMNSDEFSKDGDGESLLRLCQSLRDRCQDIIASKGERLPK